jgi:PAS domain-containing protein
MKAPGQLMVNVSRFSSIIIAVSAICVGLLLAVFLITIHAIDLASALLLGGIAGMGIKLKWTSDTLRAAERVKTKDITERKHAEAALRENESYRDLFENANDALMIATLDGIVTSVNRGFEAMTG